MSSTIPHFVRSSFETVPAGQEVHEAPPSCSVIEFSGHFVQLLSVLSLYVPAVHASENFLFVLPFFIEVFDMGQPTFREDNS